MADVTVKVLTPASSHDLLTLDEVKLLLGIASTDTSQDELIAMLVTTYSAYVAEMCNRTFAKERVSETWRDVYDGRLYLTHYPLVETDIESIEGVDVGAFEIEEQTGKLSHVVVGEATSTPWPLSAIVTYTGGYDLPTEAPPPLKQATAILIREERIKMQQAQVAGVRQLVHKEARVTFFDPNAVLVKTVGMKSSAQMIADSLLRQYQRHWI